MNSVSPELTVIVFGGHTVAASFARLVSAMEWDALVAAGPDGLDAMLPQADAIVILEHDLALAGPVLAVALASGVAYIGAMGNRATQSARREWLLGQGFSDSELARIHGPAGLDIGADTPAEIAVAIVAEIVTLRRGFAGAGHLADRPGPIHPDSVPGADHCPQG